MRAIAMAFLLLGTGCVTCAPRNADVGARYLGARYVNDPLGDGVGYDTNPLIRDDAFDCTTFVETVLAGGDVAQLNKIRYRDGIVAWENRNHFIETDWLANNSDLVENISAQYGPIRTRNVVIDKRAWAKKVHNMTINVEPVTAALEYISYADLKRINNDVPLIVLFVVGPRDTNKNIATDIAVVHMGILMPGGRVLRHASTGRGVVDDDFEKYIGMRRAMSDNKNIGIALVGIR